MKVHEIIPPRNEELVAPVASHGLVVRHYGCYANGLVFGLTLTLLTLLFFVYFFPAYVLRLWVSVRLAGTLAVRYCYATGGV